MLISHETPISMLKESIHSNDYDYALVHLFETQPEYYDFFKQSLKSGREVLLDNSIFELGVAFDSVKFAKYVEELKPTYYIVPDVLEDSAETMRSFGKFVLNYPDLKGMKIGVVQGKTYTELLECYKYMDKNSDYIAISFDYSWYQTIGYSETTDVENVHLATLERNVDGRQKLINMLMADGVWNFKKPHHLLGCSLPQEFKAYRGIDSIRSVDTSNPVVAAIKGIRYIRNIGMIQKPSTLLADLINYEVKSNAVIRDLNYNLNEFRTYCNG